MPRPVTLAIVQANPVFNQLEACLQKAASYVEKAAAQGAQLVVFGETWLSGYPAWLDHVPAMGLWDHPPTQEVFVQMRKNAVRVPGPATEILGILAKKHELTIVIGVNERVDEGPGNGTLYNSMLIFNEQGELANHHRKLTPTYTEKLVHGAGDAHGVKSVQTSWGKVGGLICWEHWMPLTRQALHDCGEDIHIALWPNVHEMLQLASRSYAFEGRCHVVAVGQLLSAADLPDAFELPPHLQSDPDQLLLKGGSAIIGPDGHYRLDPVYDREELLIHTIDLEDNDKGKLTLDVTGHYQRKDVYHFEVDRKRN